ncbi:spondin domain-containing protein [Thalassotalea sp. G2M2-11]|uniref:spondin domain-containing protein n=1 Tax=Thalassotalea sp. G2M2-11 TaxID=2787627 RepID=UPI0019D0A3F9|nr:spondin domain-containing protein [Thalassotalea sp. G2M2-11]
MKLFKYTLCLLTVPVILLSGCNDSSNSAPIKGEMKPTPVTYKYQVIVQNLTYGQPFSPLAVVLHDEGDFWQIGNTASLELENLAESGDNTMLLAANNVLSGVSSEDILMPSISQSVEITLDDHQASYLSVVTMLVNTNDAFTGINALDISSLAVGESISLMAGSYDAGTEKNTELQDTIPGPASGGTGEGFNATRDDIDLVTMHPGVVTLDDGLSTSVLTQAHRFDNPTIQVSVSRIE